MPLSAKVPVTKGKIGIEISEGDVAGADISPGLYSFEALLAMETPPLPRPVLRAIKDEMEPDPHLLGVTRLTGCLRKTFYQFTQPWFIPLENAMTLLDGRIAHSNLGNTRFQHDGWFEFPFAKQFDVESSVLRHRVTVIGIADYYDFATKTLWDWKRTSEYGAARKAEEGPWIGHVLQLQVYYTLLKDTLRIEHLKLLTFTRRKDRRLKNPVIIIHEISREDRTEWIKKQLTVLFEALDTKNVDVLPFPPDKHAWLCNKCAFRRPGLCPGIKR